MPYEVNIYVNPSYDEISNTNMIELCCEYLSVRSIRLYVRIMSHTRFRVNPHSIVAWKSIEFLDIHANIECGFTLKRVRDMIQT